MAPEVLPEADFRTLGLEPGSKPSEVKRAYRALAKKWHPDRHHSEPYETRALAEKKFREINEAYRRISGRCKESTRPARFSKKATCPGTSPSYGAQPPGTKTRVNPADWSRPKIDIQTLSRAKIMLPVLLLLAAAAFIFTQLPSFSPDRAVDTETTGGRTSVDSPPVADGSNSQGPIKESLQPPVPGSNLSGAGPALDASRASLGARKKLFSDDRPLDRFSLPPALLNPEPAAPNAFFTLGSTSSEVLAIQGPPSRVQGQTWIYGLCEVQFRNERVSRFNNFDGSLRVRMQPEGPEGLTQPDYITIGSSETEVLAVQGTPTRVESNRWFYGFAEIVFKNGRIAEYDNYFGVLKMRLLPSRSDSEPSKDFFTIGSSPDEVLAVQGTPTAIHGNRWSFDFDSVLFGERKVHSVTNAGGTLRFVAPEEQ
jgi:hypothetical protein